MMDAFRSKLHSAMKARTGRDADAQVIAEPRSAVQAEESEEENIHDSMEDSDEKKIEEFRLLGGRGRGGLCGPLPAFLEISK